MYSPSSGVESLGDYRHALARRVDLGASPPRRNDLTLWYPGPRLLHSLRQSRELPDL